MTLSKSRDLFAELMIRIREVAEACGGVAPDADQVLTVVAAVATSREADRAWGAAVAFARGRLESPPPTPLERDVAELVNEVGGAIADGSISGPSSGVERLRALHAKLAPRAARKAG